MLSALVNKAEPSTREKLREGARPAWVVAAYEVDENVDIAPTTLAELRGLIEANSARGVHLLKVRRHTQPASATKYSLRHFFPDNWCTRSHELWKMAQYIFENGRGCNGYSWRRTHISCRISIALRAVCDSTEEFRDNIRYAKWSGSLHTHLFAFQMSGLEGMDTTRRHTYMNLQKRATSSLFYLLSLLCTSIIQTPLGKPQATGYANSLRSSLWLTPVSSLLQLAGEKHWYSFIAQQASKRQQT